MMGLGDRIKDLRISKGFSQAALARRASISNDYMFRIEAGKVTNIGTEVIDSIAEALEVHPSLLLYGQVITPKVTLPNQDSIGPLNEQEKTLISNFRNIAGGDRKIIQSLARRLSERD